MLLVIIHFTEMYIQCTMFAYCSEIKIQMKKKHSRFVAVNSYATHKELAAKQPRFMQRTCCRVNSNHTQEPHKKTLAGKTATQHEKSLLVKSYVKGKLPVSSYAIFFGTTFELSGIDEGWVGDLS